MINNGDKSLKKIGKHWKDIILVGGGIFPPIFTDITGPFNGTDCFRITPIILFNDELLTVRLVFQPIPQNKYYYERGKVLLFISSHQS